ncbi:conserved hypothetical protein [Trichinella spiralis]|uniref:hypothetical protein n=1 Tax=Trichinella spiralis TaxID=6334 RepID=UPI0001EFC55D|nr:conserved hypothetical protein [Trichinella spiralis]
MLSTKRVLIQRLSPHLNHCSQIERHCSIVIYYISDKPGSCAVQIIKQQSFFSPFGSSFITNFLTASLAFRGTMTGCSTSTAVTSLASVNFESFFSPFGSPIITGFSTVSSAIGGTMFS